MASPLIRADFCGPYIGDCINGIKEKGGSAYLKYRRIPKVTAPVTFGFSRPKEPLLSGSRYFRMVKKRL